jgi:hypothetical protein
MQQDHEEDSYDDIAKEAEETDEDEDEYSSAELGFMKGYEEELDDPYEEHRVEEEAEY